MTEDKSNNGWKIAATQTLCLQQIGSDLHHYFPVSLLLSYGLYHYSIMEHIMLN
jgi:hypothetical protein